MQAINTSFGSISVFDLFQAHMQLESDYNLGGWLHERPSNVRRMASTGVQLSRMKFDSKSRWVDICADAKDTESKDDEDVRLVYVANALQYKLPIEDDLKAVALRLFDAELLHQVRPELFPAAAKRSAHKP